MGKFYSKDFDEMEKFYRAKFINSLSGIKSANLVGTVDENGQENLSIVSSVVHIGANPALMAIVFRPATVPRHTFENIRDTKVFTINHVKSDFFKKAHQTSARYEKSMSEFEAVGLNTDYVEGVEAPFVKESLLKIGLKLREIIHLDINKTELVIGEVIFVDVDDNYIEQDGYIDIEALGSVGVTGLDSYHELKEATRLSYAKPGQEVKEL